jgi:hypothetical protein
MGTESREEFDEDSSIFLNSLIFLETYYECRKQNGQFHRIIYIKRNIELFAFIIT